MFPIRLRTERLTIREYTPDDIDLIHQYTAEQQGIFFHENPDLSRKDVEDWLDALLRLAKEPTRYRHQFAVELLETGTLIGSARVHIDVPDDRQGSVGYAYPRAYWGRGYGTESARAMLDFGFDELGLHRIEATIEPDNLGSVRVAEKLGMRLEGHMKERFHTPAGWRDSLLYATTEDEWRTERPSSSAI
jgi:RimJ/RimL family protein N-acetyltransferase